VDMGHVLERLAETAAQVLAAQAGAVFLLEETGDRLKVAAVHGTSALRVGAQLGAPPLLPSGFHTALHSPLGPADRPLGILYVYGTRPDQFSDADAERLQAVAGLGTAALEAAQRLVDLERIEASKAQFIRVATHELRSPVTVAQSLVRAVLKGYAGSLHGQQKDVFARIAGRLDFLESLVNDLLDLAAGKAPNLTEEEGPVAINASVGRAVLLLQAGAEEKGVALTLQPCGEELATWATEEGLDRIFVNLVGNAVKYTPPEGSVTVSLHRTGEEIRVKVADTGIGIPKEALSHLFEEFYRAPNARALNAVGTGLGLAIVKDLVDRYGGRIEVASAEGEGTTFTVIFPLYAPSARA
jgi:two-component system phosphate regulon sensor histidine kinase PhoR